MDLAIPPDLLPYYVVAAATLLLATWLLYLDPASRVNRAFSVILLLRGVALIVSPAIESTSPGRAYVAMLNFVPYYIIPVAPAIVYFLSTYPRPRGIFGTTRWGPWALLGATVAILAWYLIDHAIYADVTLVGGALAYERGPLWFFLPLRLPVTAAAAYIMARDYRREPHGSQGFSIFLVAAGFTLSALFDGTQFLISAFQSIDQLGFVNWLEGTWLMQVISALSLPIALAAVVEMARAMRHEKADSTLQEARRFLFVAAPLAIACGAGGAIAQDLGRPEIKEFIRSLWSLLVPALIGYALIRFSLFNVDIRLKAGVRRSIVLGGFTVAFFIITEAAEELLQGDGGPLIGIAGAAIVALAARPLQEGAKRAADALMPDTKPISQMSTGERHAMYHDQFMLVYDDGTLTVKERRMLDGLAAALGLSADEAAGLERPGLEMDPEPSAPVTTRQRTTFRVQFLAAGITALAFGAMAQGLEFLVPADSLLLGLLSAAIIAAMLGPIENLAGRLLGLKERPDPAHVSTYTKAVDEAVADGELSRRDRLYLKGLAERLGLDGGTRRSVDRKTLAVHGVRRWSS